MMDIGEIFIEILTVVSNSITACFSPDIAFLVRFA